MALLDKTVGYDLLKAPFYGHALADELVERGGRWEFVGSYSFSSEGEYQQLKIRDTLASEEDKEIDRWTGEAKNVHTWDQIQGDLPTWAELEARHQHNLEEYDSLAGKRARKYPDWRDQLDMLYKDINNGKLGEAAKTSTFYTTIKAVKDSSQ